jgi:hypothetical protein
MAGGYALGAVQLHAQAGRRRSIAWRSVHVAAAQERRARREGRADPNQQRKGREAQGEEADLAEAPRGARPDPPGSGPRAHRSQV